MAGYRLSVEAEADLAGIYEYSVLTFGLKKAQEYLFGMNSAFTLLGENRRLGRDCSYIYPHSRRHEYARHVIYYRLEGSDILVLRVLHASQDPMINFLR